jgi:two-component system response regulator HydG
MCTDLDEALDHAASGQFEIVIAGLDFEEDGGWRILRTALRSMPESQVVLLGDSDGISGAVRAMTYGAANYLHKPVNPSELSIVVSRLAESISLIRDRAALQKQVQKRYSFPNIVGNSSSMRRVFERIQQASATDATVLVQGETGTGKELVASAIHFNSLRKNNRFVPLNCAGLVETILESELFGHEKGAFTGATNARVGMFEYANHGTLFLDEIGDMPLSSQVKLLRVLEHGEIVRVGSNEQIKVDVRLVAATHQNLLEKVEDGTFRKDLFYRLNVVTINLPPLRERREDIPLLIDHFLRRLSENHGKSIHGLSADVKKFLYRYDWPGNVRELRNCLEHMVVLTNTPVLDKDDLPEYILEEMGEKTGGVTLDAMAGQPLEEIEKQHIDRTLKLVDGNREKAAELLGIGERTLYRKIGKYNLN